MESGLRVGSPECAVWLARPAVVDAPDRSLPLLSAAERARHDRFYFERDRQLFRVAHALTREVLGALLGLAPEEVAFVTNEHGRPAVEVDGVHFNLSHTKGLVALAVTGGGYEVGVDVERRENERVDDALARTCFEARELAGFRARPDRARQVDRFYQLWTLKEAYMKGRGLGFHLPLKRFAFDLDRDGIGLWVDADHDDGRPWSFRHEFPTETHALALAVQLSSLPPIATHWVQPPP